jgi:hypothetical protein
MQKWIILHRIGGNEEPCWFGDDDRPVVYDSEKEATENLLDDFISSLQNQLAEVKYDMRKPDEVDLECDDWVEACTVLEDGVITTGFGIVYDPKTFVR